METTHAARRVDPNGFVSYRGSAYKMGKGMIGEWVGIAPGANDAELRVCYAGFTLGKLQEFAK